MGTKISVTREQFELVHYLHNNEKLLYRDIAQQVPVSVSTISRILNNPKPYLRYYSRERKLEEENATAEKQRIENSRAIESTKEQAGVET